MITILWVFCCLQTKQSCVDKHRMTKQKLFVGAPLYRVHRFPAASLRLVNFKCCCIYGT